jgi:PPOX class probable F420-dependent enzyme
MWFSYDGESVRLTHTRTRQKYRNLMADPAIALSISDPDQPYRYLELRGVLDRVEPDPQGTFFRSLGRRYGAADQKPADAPDRVTLIVRPRAASYQ